MDMHRGRGWGASVRASESGFVPPLISYTRAQGRFCSALRIDCGVGVSMLIWCRGEAHADGARGVVAHRRMDSDGCSCGANSGP